MKKQCIYCKQFKTEAQFNTEHVIPRAFGRFHSNSPTLRCVCEGCNTFFGGSLDQPFARDSFEGFERRIFGIWPKEERKQQRIEIKVLDHEFAKGLIAKTRRGKDGEFESYAPSQIGIFNIEKKDYEFFEPDGLPSKEDLLAKYEMKEHTIDFRPQGDDPIDILLKPFKERGLEISLVDEGSVDMNSQMTVNKAWIQATIRLDSTIMRALSKITFNYLAAVAGSEFVLKPDFDMIREYIRYEKHCEHEKIFFSPNQPPVLSEERLLYKMGFKVKTRIGHIIVVQWDDSKRDVVGRVSMFNRNVYAVRLCRSFAGIWREIRHGHYFDFKSKTVHRLFSNPASFVRVPANRS